MYCCDQILDFVELEGGRLEFPQQNLLFYYDILLSIIVMYGIGPLNSDILGSVIVMYPIGPNQMRFVYPIQNV